MHWTTAYPGHAAALLTAFCWTLSSLALARAVREAGSLTVNIIRRSSSSPSWSSSTASG